MQTTQADCGSADFCGQITNRDDRAGGEYHSPLHRILEFPHIAGPSVTCRACQCRRLNVHNRTIHRQARMLNKVTRQCRNILTPFA